MLVLPSQTPGLIEGFGLSRLAADTEVWAIEPTGKKYAGAAAVNRVLAALGGIWLVLSWTFRILPIRLLEDRAYRWIAENRSKLDRIGVTPECERPGICCE